MAKNPNRVPGSGGGSGGGGAPKPPPGKQRNGTRDVIQHFNAQHNTAAARGLKQLYKGGAPTAAQKAKFAAAHPGMVKNHPAVAKRLLGVGKKAKTSGS